MELCKKCNKNERVGYKYCKSCQKEVKRIADLASQKRARDKRRGNHLCEECHEEKCTHKYCNTCAKIVIRRKAYERRVAKKARGGATGRPEYNPPKDSKSINPKFLERGTIRYAGYSNAG